MIERKNIRQCLSDSIFDLLGKSTLDSLSVKQICANCSVSRRAFYNYYKDKYDLLNQSVRFRIRQCIHARNDRIDWYSSARNILDEFYKNPKVYKNAFSYIGQNNLEEYLNDSFYESYMFWVDSVEEGDGEQKERFSFVVEFFTRGIAHSISKWVSSGMQVTPNEMVELLELCMPPLIRKWFLM